MPFQNADLKQLLDRLHAAGFEAWLVGGAVRDALLGLPCGDLDVTTNAAPEKLMALFAGAVPSGGEYGTVSVQVGAARAEVTPYRKESGYTDGRHPDRVEWAATLQEDLTRRDFTVNAMAWDGAVLADPFGGQADLNKNLLRCVGEPALRFEQDALRILRLFRFACRLGFEIEESTLAAALEKAAGLVLLPAARVRQELAGALAGAHPARLAPLVKSGALAPFGLPAPKGEAANAALSRLDSLPDDGLLRWWALGRICGADMGAVCQLLGFSGKALAEWDRLGRAFAAVCADGEGLRRLLSRGLPAEPQQVFAAFCLLDDRWQRVWPLWEEQQRCGYAYNRQMLAVRPATLMEWGIRGKKLGRVMDGLVEMVIRDPSLNRLETLLQLAGALALLP